MKTLNCRDRVIRCLRGREIDRIPTFDILHNIDLIEAVTGREVTPANAEDLLCETASTLLDLVRHFAVPADRERTIVKDENGFVYEFHWWTGHVVERPRFRSSGEIESSVKRDIDIIYDCIGKKKECHIARQHVRLFDEPFTTFEEVKSGFRRISQKLGETVMLAPEDVSAVAVAAERYDETGWWYLYHDHPGTASRYLDALTDYQLAFIDDFADPSVAPFAQISVPVGTTTGLLYPPEFYRREVIPRERRKVEQWKKHGCYVLAFLDGYKWPLLDEFLALGVDEVHPCEDYCGMSVKALRQKYPELVIGQPVDCTRLLPYGTEAEVRRAVTAAIEDAGARRIIIGSTSEIHPAVKVDNALAMYETARRYPL